MSDTLKGADQLNLSADGRTATNWRPYAQQLENLLSAREVHGICSNPLGCNDYT